LRHYACEFALPWTCGQGQNLGVAGTGGARPLPASGVPDYWIVLLATLDIELGVPPVV